MTLVKNSFHVGPCSPQVPIRSPIIGKASDFGKEPHANIVSSQNMGQAFARSESRAKRQRLHVTCGHAGSRAKRQLGFRV